MWLCRLADEKCRDLRGVGEWLIEDTGHARYRRSRLVRRDANFSVAGPQVSSHGSRMPRFIEVFFFKAHGKGPHRRMAVLLHQRDDER